MRVNPKQTVFVEARVLADMRKVQVKPMHAVVVGARLRAVAREMKVKPMHIVFVDERLLADSREMQQVDANGLDRGALARGRAGDTGHADADGVCSRCVCSRARGRSRSSGCKRSWSGCAGARTHRHEGHGDADDLGRVELARGLVEAAGHTVEARLPADP